MPNQDKYKCFDLPFIGVHGCNDKSNSGLYVDDLPGISIDRASLLADDHNHRAEEFIRSVELEAIKLTSLDFENMLQSEVSIRDTLEVNTIDYRFSGDFSPMLDIGEFVGFRIERNRKDKLTDIGVTCITLHSEIIQRKKIHIQEDGCPPYSVDVDLKCGKNVIRLDICSDADDLLIYTESCGLNNYKEAICIKECDKCTPEYRSCLIGNQVYKDSAESEWDHKHHSIGIEYECKCNIAPIICEAKNDLAYAIRLKMGILIMQHHLNSNRCNEFVLNSKDQAAMNLLLWRGGKQDGIIESGEYWDTLRAIVKKVSTKLHKNGSACVICNRMKSVISIP